MVQHHPVNAGMLLIARGLSTPLRELAKYNATHVITACITG